MSCSSWRRRMRCAVASGHCTTSSRPVGRGLAISRRGWLPAPLERPAPCSQVALPAWPWSPRRAPGRRNSGAIAARICRFTQHPNPPAWPTTERRIHFAWAAQNDGGTRTLVLLRVVGDDFGPFFRAGASDDDDNWFVVAQVEGGVWHTWLDEDEIARAVD